jgi:glycosyltransferase involved in cell wall biosynthesis
VLYRFGREACTRRTCLRCTLHARRPPQVWRLSGAVPRALRHLDRLLLPSRFALERHRHLEVPKTVLPHFVPIPEEVPERDADAPPYALFVGRLEPLKGLADILPLFTEDLGAELRVVGTGSQEEALRQEAAAKGLRVRFLGPLHPEALADHYRNAVALIAPSRCYETFGMTVAEAFAQGTPAIARGHGALAELIEDSGAGYAFDTPEACRQALRRLLDDPELRRRLGREGRRAARERYSEEAHMKRYLELIHTLQQGKTTR